MQAGLILCCSNLWQVPYLKGAVHLLHHYNIYVEFMNVSKSLICIISSYTEINSVRHYSMPGFWKCYLQVRENSVML